MKALGFCYQEQSANRLFQRILRGFFFSLLFLFVLSTSITHSQPIMSMEGKMNNLSEEDSEYLQSLVTDLKSTFYFKDGQLIQYGSASPQVIFFDKGSIDLLYQNNPNYMNVELIRMKLLSESDLPSILQVDNLSGFPNLKYIYFQFNYPPCPGSEQTCIPGILESIISEGANGAGPLHKRSGESQLTVIYGVSILE